MMDHERTLNFFQSHDSTSQFRSTLESVAVTTESKQKTDVTSRFHLNSETLHNHYKEYRNDSV